MTDLDRAARDWLVEMAAKATPLPWGRVALPIVLPDGKPLMDNDENGYMISSPSSEEKLRRIREKDFPFTSVRIAILEETHYQPAPTCDANAEYIVAACNAAPALVAQVNRLEEERDAALRERDEARQQVDRLRAGCNPTCPGCGLRPCNEHGKAVLWCDECVLRLTGERDEARQQVAWAAESAPKHG